MKKRFAASAMILAMSAATVLSPLTAFAEAEEQELNIAIFQGGYGDAYWNQMVELFEESHEGVKVNMTISPTIGDIIRPQIVAGNAPDFICLNDGGEDGVILSLIKDHALLNLDDVFDGENYAGTGTLRDDITDGILSSTKCAPYGDDEIYLAPFNSGPQGLIYNKTFFDENNLEVPKTWDEFFALGDKVKDIDGRALFTYQGIYPGYMEEMLWPAIANECGEEALTKIANYEEGSFNNEGVLKALSHIKEIADKGYWSLEEAEVLIQNIIGYWPVLHGKLDKNATREKTMFSNAGYQEFEVRAIGMIRTLSALIDSLTVPLGEKSKADIRNMCNEMKEYGVATSELELYLLKDDELEAFVADIRTSLGGENENAIIDALRAASVLMKKYPESSAAKKLLKELLNLFHYRKTTGLVSVIWILHNLVYEHSGLITAKIVRELDGNLFTFSQLESYSKEQIAAQKACAALAYRLKLWKPKYCGAGVDAWEKLCSGEIWNEVKNEWLDK